MNERHAAFLDLLARSQMRVTRYIRSMTRDDEDARDVFSDTVLIAYEQFDTLRDPDAFLFYLFTIVRRRVTRNRWRRRLFAPMTEHAETTASTAGPTPDQHADIMILHRAIDRLPFAQREAISLHALAGLSIDEVARLQKSSPNTVKSRIQRGRHRLAQLLGVHDPEYPSHVSQPAAVARFTIAEQKLLAED